MESTWGHLRARPGTRHPVSFVFGRDLEGYAFLLAFTSPDGLDDSPWLHEDTHDRIDHELSRLAALPRYRGGMRGRVWQFVGEYVVHKNGRRRFVGRVRPVRLRLTPPRGPRAAPPRDPA